MEAEAAKLIGAGIAAIGTGAAGIGVGNLFGQFLQGALRNPSAADGQFGRPDLRFCGDGSAGHFRPSDRSPAALRRLISRAANGLGRPDLGPAPK